MKLCMSIIKKITGSLPFQVNLKPGQSLRDWQKAQAQRLQTCAKGAKKMSMMDNLETQPLDDEEAKTSFAALLCVFHLAAERRCNV